MYSSTQGWIWLVGLESRTHGDKQRAMHTRFRFFYFYGETSFRRRRTLRSPSVLVMVTVVWVDLCPSKSLSVFNNGNSSFNPT